MHVFIVWLANKADNWEANISLALIYFKAVHSKKEKARDLNISTFFKISQLFCNRYLASI